MRDGKNLPEWAKNQIRTLELRVEELKKRLTDFSEQKPTAISVQYPSFDRKDIGKELYLPDDRFVKFLTGPQHHQWIQIHVVKKNNHFNPHIEMYAGGDFRIEPEVRNRLRIYVKE